MRRGAALSGLLLLIALPGTSQAEPGEASARRLQLLMQRVPATPARESQRQALLHRAEAALRAGDGETALLQLDEAAALAHAADTELLMVQAQLQQGAYRRALAFASHTAGAHLQEPRALQLYAWLLALGEQPGPAMALLDQGLERHPDDATLLALRTQLARLQPGAAAEAEAAMARSRPGPLPVGDAPPSARALGSGLLLDAGRLALVPLAAAPTAGRLWVVDGLGRGSPAQAQQRLEASGLALLRLERPLPAPALRRAPRDAFAGSPAALLQHPADPAGRPAWPALHSGFLGRVDAQGRQALGITPPLGGRGGPVFDLAGRLIGLTPDGASLLPLSHLDKELGALLRELPVDTSATMRLPDQRYEEALPLTVQVLAAD